MAPVSQAHAVNGVGLLLDLFCLSLTRLQERVATITWAEPKKTDDAAEKVRTYCSLFLLIEALKHSLYPERKEHARGLLQRNTIYVVDLNYAPWIRYDHGQCTRGGLQCFSSKISFVLQQHALTIHTYVCQLRLGCCCFWYNPVVLAYPASSVGVLPFTCLFGAAASQVHLCGEPTRNSNRGEADRALQNPWRGREAAAGVWGWLPGGVLTVGQGGVDRFGRCLCTPGLQIQGQVGL